MTYNKFSFIFIVLFSVFIPESVLANSKSNKTHLFLDNLTPVCWYKDAKYSEGALIVMADKTFVCASKYDNQITGELKWRIADENGRPIPHKPKKTIRIN
ncbi:DUF1496 domain-containing protein [Pseudoalteromonas phenolica]|uniref:DUF1496 domain-containing protein n=1 Tax=Pseudoalteromonas phenolica TaxID=161398 RepID=UPI00110A3899|nr:DUF1496 domain-containing protein [Pseudoalteromonas phenolica]TMO55635.1 hypothetical protein CWC21_09305 [Pseudoalteromonas phenolica]